MHQAAKDYYDGLFKTGMVLKQRYQKEGLVFTIFKQGDQKNTVAYCSPSFAKGNGPSSLIKDLTTYLPYQDFKPLPSLVSEYFGMEFTETKAPDALLHSEWFNPKQVVLEGRIKAYPACPLYCSGESVLMLSPEGEVVKVLAAVVDGSLVPVPAITQVVVLGVVVRRGKKQKIHFRV